MLSLIAFAAAALAGSTPHTGNPGTANSDSWDTVPIYVATRGALAVPAAAHGDVAVGGLSLGILTDEAGRNAIGLRVSYMDAPPESPFARDTPPLPYAWGPVVDWTLVTRPQQRASFFFSASAGYVYGTPEEESHDNLILPILEGGVGLRFSKRLREGQLLYVAPELGFVPGAVAPLTALNVGFIFPSSSSAWGA